MTVTQEQAQMLAQHAIHVQGGFSTPEVEKARAEQQLAQGGSIDFDQMKNELQTALMAKVKALPQPQPTTAPAVPLDESEAAAAEGLAEMPPEIQDLRSRKLQIDQEMGDLQKELDKIKGEVDAALTSQGLQGFTLHGKVKARKSPGIRSSVDAKQLKVDLPEVYQKYLRITKYTSIRIT